MAFNSSYTGQQVDDLLDIVSSGGTVAKDFRGVLVKEVAGGQAISAATATPITFDTEDFDTEAFADLGTNDDRITIPTGVTKVQLFGILTANADIATSSDIALRIKHYNSSDVLQETYSNGAKSGYTSVSPDAQTPVISVVATDYFELEVECTDAFTVDEAFFGLEYKDGTLHVTGVTLEDAEKLVWQGI